MKPWRLIFLTVLICLVFFQTAAAHEYKTDGSITVLLHSNPDDDPIVGEPAALFFQVTDTENKFKEANCDCTIKISENGKLLLTDSLLRISGPSIYSLTIPFTFPKKAVYQIEVTGKPRTANVFASFQVKYDLRIAKGEETSSEKPNSWLVLGCVLGLVGTVIAVIHYRKK